jgi:hypothetical protein
MNLHDVNYQAWSGTAANLVKFLKAFGHDKRAVYYMQKGVDGFKVQEYAQSWNDTDFIPYKTPAVEKAVKSDIMADFYAKQGVFAPKPDAALKELSDKFNAQAKQIEELKKTVAEQQKTIETIKKNPPEHPSIH